MEIASVFSYSLDNFPAVEVYQTMETIYLISTTLEDKDAAHHLAAHLLDQRLIACAQITGPVTSLFRWQGEQTTAEEWLLTVKTAPHLAQATKVEISQKHPYEVPEIIGQEVGDVSESYRTWLAEEVRP
ncbi:MAG: divalent-cation tolerance protein CutA [Desulforhopalus sp.]|jgi:periplasmic divalent cation tolerance protein|nr:divalent-cation tolerance protein CutA [Desulforhopalus sp.]